METAKIEELIRIMQVYGLSELQLESGEEKLKLVQQAQTTLYPQGLSPTFPAVTVNPLAASPAPAAEPAAADTPSSEAAPTNAVEIKSPFVGTYYSAPSPGADLFVQVGQRVRKGETLCIIEAMKLMNEIEADRDGTIVKIFVDNEAPVEFDQTLFLIEP